MGSTALPSDISIDSSVFAAAIITGGDLHSPAAQRFCADVARQNCTVYFSQFVRSEVADFVRRLATRGVLPVHMQQQFNLSQFQWDIRVRQRWMVYGMAEFERLTGTFATRFELPYDQFIIRHSLRVMSAFSPRSYDAVHVTTALRAHVRDFAAVDGHFMSVRGLRLILIR